MTTIDERSIDPIAEMTNIAQSILSLSTRGFKETFRSAKPGELIYDSVWCRINFVWGGWDPLGGNTISIYYGRLHAPNESPIMIFNGEECHSNHPVNSYQLELDNS